MQALLPGFTLEVTGARLRALLAARVARIEARTVALRKAAETKTDIAALGAELREQLEAVPYSSGGAYGNAYPVMPMIPGHPGVANMIEQAIGRLDVQRFELTWLHDSIEVDRKYTVTRFDLGLFGGFDQNGPSVGMGIAI